MDKDKVKVKVDHRKDILRNIVVCTVQYSTVQYSSTGLSAHSYGSVELSANDENLLLSSMPVLAIFFAAIISFLIAREITNK